MGASQDRANMAWAFSVLTINDDPLRKALASQAIRTISQFCQQHQATTAWAYSSLIVHHQPLMTAIAAEALKSIYGVGLNSMSTAHVISFSQQWVPFVEQCGWRYMLDSP